MLGHEDVEEIRDAHVLGKSTAEIALRFEVSERHVRRLTEGIAVASAIVRVEPGEPVESAEARRDDDIREDHSRGFSVAQLAVRFEITESQVRRVLAGDEPYVPVKRFAVSAGESVRAAARRHLASLRVRGEDAERFGAALQLAGRLERADDVSAPGLAGELVDSLAELEGEREPDGLAQLQRRHDARKLLAATRSAANGGG